MLVAQNMSQNTKTMKPVETLVSTIAKNKQYSKVLCKLSDKETKALARSKKIEALISGQDFRRAQEAEIDTYTDQFLTKSKNSKKKPIK